MILTPAEIARATGGLLIHDGPAGPIRTDSRALTPGDWFLALRGDRFDGHEFLPKARELGCAGVIAERAPEGWDRGFVKTPRTLEALQNCARWARWKLNCPVVGVTGSAGKTTTRALIAELLAPLGRVHQNEGNLNNHIGVPLTLLACPDEPDAVVLEMGMSDYGEIRLLRDIGQPNIRLITSVGAAHTEAIGSVQGVARCKQELFDGARAGDWVIVNVDDEHIRQMPLPKGAGILRFGMGERADVRLLRAELDPEHLTTELVLRLPDGELLTATLPAPGVHLARNAAGAVAVAWALGVPSRSYAESIARYAPVGMRMRVERRRGGITVLNDAYNANPLSMRASLDSLAAVRGRRRVALLGDMLELGEVEDGAHRELAAYAASLGIEVLGLAGPRFSAVAETAKSAKSLLVAPDAEALAERVQGVLRPDDVVLIKGSRGSKMERSLVWLPLEAPPEPEG